MTLVGTPVFTAPEILTNDRYDSKADVYSFAICLIAMVRAERRAVDFFFESLRKHLKVKEIRSIGINIMNNQVVNKNWRPLIPRAFRASYPRFTKLLKACWQGNPKDRPNFDEIVRRLNAEVRDEVNASPEPVISLLHHQKDSEYWEDMANGGGLSEPTNDATLKDLNADEWKEKYKFANEKLELLQDKFQFELDAALLKRVVSESTMGSTVGGTVSASASGAEEEEETISEDPIVISGKGDEERGVCRVLRTETVETMETFPSDVP
jgi:serine/threonine protein kinase